MATARKRKIKTGAKLPTPSSRRVMSIRLIISLAAVVLIASSVICVSWVAERHAREALTKEIENRLLLEARNLAFVSIDALLSPFPELTLCPAVKEMQSNRPDLAFLTVLNHEGLIKGHVDLRALDNPFDDLEQYAPVVTELNLAAGEAILGDDEMAVASVPITHPNGKNLGTAIVGMRRSYQENLVLRARQELILFTTALLAVGAILALLLMSHLLRPVDFLREGLERIGRGDLDTPLQVKDRTELGLLADTVNGMAARLKSTQAEMLEKERLDHEMDLAHRMQKSLMPESATSMDNFVIEGSYRAAAEVGGDYYDVFTLPDGRVGLVIADVAGKGMGGCLITSMLAVLIRSLRDKFSSPKSLLVALEETLIDSLEPGVFITIFYGMLDTPTGELTFASAGHSPLLVYRQNSSQVECLRTRGIPVGAWRGGALGKSLEDCKVDLAPGDIAVQFTDGINEAWNSKLKEEFGFKRIEQAIAAMAPLGADAVLKRIQKEVAAWTEPESPEDDQTLLIINWEGAQSKRPQSRHLDTGVTIRKMEPREQLNEMLEDIYHLAIKAEYDQLVLFRQWIESSQELKILSKSDKRLVENSLHEACANIIEHGYKEGNTQDIDIWWLPAGLNMKFITVPENTNSPNKNPINNHKCLGYFIIRDQGVGFAPLNWKPPDFQDPRVRRQGRGFGMHIIYSSMEKVVYIPNTPTGNLTLLRFVPHTQPTEGDVCHV